MRAMIIASNSGLTKFMAETENNRHILFETQQSLQLLSGNQVKGEFDQPGHAVFVTSGGVMFEANIIESQGSIDQNVIWLETATT